MHRTHLPAALLAACLAHPAIAAATEPCDDYAAELTAMATADQALRRGIDYLDPDSAPQRRLSSHIMLVDRTNTERLKGLLGRCGWPSSATHGAQAVKDAWLVVQHADRDLAFQKQVLALVAQGAAAGGDGPDQSYAYLYDRIAVMEKRPQHYGTQLSAPTRQYCALAFDPMDDRTKVEARRAQLGMAPLDDYRRSVLAMQRCPVPPQHPSDYHYAPPLGQGKQTADVKRK
ncbi:DUF6624 domain-containing protein [Massilia sp. X63]|uniref:DUF6624 domain-containing protein n=1 Tax=Massilia sp. X63 TaxID=3237285 RepID=UPI0034DDC600